jgi:hypothetical protein
VAWEINRGFLFVQFESNETLQIWRDLRDVIMDLDQFAKLGRLYTDSALPLFDKLIYGFRKLGSAIPTFFIYPREGNRVRFEYLGATYEMLLSPGVLGPPVVGNAEMHLYFKVQRISVDPRGLTQLEIQFSVEMLSDGTGLVVSVEKGIQKIKIPSQTESIFTYVLKKTVGIF